MSGTPDVAGGIAIAKAGREWVVYAAPIAGKSAPLGRVNRRKDAVALRTALLDELPGVRNLTALFDEQGQPVDLEAGQKVWARLTAIGNAAPWVAWRQANGVCLECGVRSCGSTYTGMCDPDGPVDRFRGGRIPAELRRWAT